MSSILRTELVLVVLVAAFGCGKSDQRSSEGRALDRLTQASAPVAGLAMEEAPDADAMLAGKKTGRSTRRGQGEAGAQDFYLKPGFVPSSLSEERLLEYRIHLSYRTEDFGGARSLLLSVVGKRGFLGETSTSLKDRARMQASFAVRSAELTEVLRELDGLGSLRREHITVTDHTEPFVLQQRTASREELRSRRKASVSSTGLVAKNWAERNAALEQSENALDRATQEQWKLRDRARWARVQIELLGPQTAPIVAIPPYRRALVGLLNLSLDVSYGLLWFSPLLVLLALLWLLRRRLENWLARVRGRESAA